MRPVARRSLWVAASLVFLAFLFWSFQTYLVGGVGVGEPVPDLAFFSLDGQPVTLSSWRGKGVILRLSSVGCTSCVDDFELLDQWQAVLGDDVVVAAVQVGDTAASVRAALGGRRVGVPVLLDPEGHAAAALGLRFVPGVYFITRRGTLSSVATTEITRVDVPGHVQLMLLGGPNIQQEIKRIATQIRCRECEGRSIWESDAPTSIAMREEVRQALLSGLRAEEVLAAFEERYGEWILMAPPARGFYALVWALPAVALGGGLALWGRLLARSRRARGREEEFLEAVVDEATRRELGRRIDEYWS